MCGLQLPLPARPVRVAKVRSDRVPLLLDRPHVIMSRLGEQSTAVISGVRVRKMELLGCDGEDGVLSSGCGVIEVSLGRPQPIDRITFVNSYAASLTIRAKVNKTGNKQVWRTVLHDYQLMPNPHFEEKSQDEFELFGGNETKLAKCGPLSALRFVLHQPSPNWSDFSIENIQLHSAAIKPDDASQKKATTAAATTADKKWEGGVEDDHQLATDTQLVADDMNRILQVAATLSSLNPPDLTQSLGRFEIGGSYDVSMLTYNSNNSGSAKSN